MKSFEYRTLITGASSGIGAALAEECAKRGSRTLCICGRNEERLLAVAAKCRAHGAEVRAEVVDVADRAAMESWVGRCMRESSIEVVFSNAGVATGRETSENVRRTFDINVGGMLNSVLPAIDMFRESGSTGRRRRQIVITASIAGYGPLPACPAYAATKAAAKNWGLSLRGMLRREGIMVNVICPGFVRSRITDRNTCPMPFFMEADKAAAVILDRVEKNRGLIAFPWPMRFGAWALSTLPWRLSEMISAILPEKNDDNRIKPERG